MALGHVKRGGGYSWVGFRFFFLNILIILLSCRWVCSKSFKSGFYTVSLQMHIPWRKYFKSSKLIILRASQGPNWDNLMMGWGIGVCQWFIFCTRPTNPNFRISLPPKIATLLAYTKRFLTSSKSHLCYCWFEQIPKILGFFFLRP